MQLRHQARRTGLFAALFLAACSGESTTGLAFSGPPAAVRLQFCADAVPAWVGYQNGNGPWTTLQADAAGSYSYSFTVNGGGALAYVLPEGGDGSSYGYATEVLFGSADELQHFLVADCTGVVSSGSKTVSGALSGLGLNELGVIQIGASEAGVISADGTDVSYTLREVPEGPQDLVAVRRTSVSEFGDVARMIVRRGINPTDGAMLTALDFNGAEALQPVNALLAVSGTESGQLVDVTSTFITAGGANVVFTGTETTSQSVPFEGVGTGAIDGDLHVLSLATQWSDITVSAAESYFLRAASRGIALGPALDPITVTGISAAPNVHFRMTIPGSPAYGMAAVAEYNAGGFGPSNRDAEVTVTSAYLGGAPSTWTVTMPDFSAATGFNASLGFQTGLGLSYAGILTGGTRNFFARPLDGQMMSYSVREGSSVSNASGMRASPRFLTPAKLRAMRALRTNASH